MMSDLREDEEMNDTEDERDDEAEDVAVRSAIDAALASTEVSTRVLGAIAVYLRDIAQALSPCGHFDTVQESIDGVAKAISEREGRKI